MRVLHLLDPAVCGDEGPLACATAVHATREGARDFSHHVWLIGRDSDERRCWSLGLLTTDRVHPRPCAFVGPDPTVRALRRLRAARAGRSPEWPPDLIQCWSLSGLRIARSVFGAGTGSPARCAVLLRPPERVPSSATDSGLATGREVIATIDESTRRAAATVLGGSRLHNADRWLPAIRLLAPPAFPPGGPASVDRAALRQMLGLHDSDVAIALLADPPDRADAQRLAFALGVVSAVGRRATLLVRSGSSSERRAAAYLLAHQRRWGMVAADLSLPELLGACDMAVIDASQNSGPNATPTCGPTAVSLAVSMGVPVVSPTPFFRGWPVLAAPSRSLGGLAAPIREYLENASVRTELAARRRAFCQRLRSDAGFSGVLHAIWREQLNLSSPAPPAPADAPLVP